MNKPESRIKELEEELAVSDRLLKDYQELLEVIPGCPLHGNRCLPHARRWVTRMVAMEARLKALLGEDSANE